MTHRAFLLLLAAASPLSAQPLPTPTPAPAGTPTYLPTVPRGNTNGPVIALAERAADLIRGRTPLASQQAELPEAAPTQ